MVTHKIILTRFAEGMGFNDLCAKYNLAERELEEILRAVVVRDAQAKIDFDADGAQEDEPASDQMTIAERYGEIEIL